MSMIPNEAFFRIFGSGEAPGARVGNYATADDRPALLAMCRTLRARNVVEIGVQRGTTAALLLRECPWIERYIGIDIPADFTPTLAKQASEIPARAGELCEADPRFVLLLAPSGSRHLTPADFPTPADLVYIDGSHDEEDVWHDTKLARAITRPGGIIAWHDYPSCQGVRDVIDVINGAEGDQICFIEGTWLCVQFWRGPAAPKAEA